MITEYEVRVLEIDVEEMIKKIEDMGAKKIGEYEQKRYVYDIKPAEDGKWIRLRTNGKKTTITYKDIVSKTIDGTKEIEITVDNFETTNEFLEKIGFIHKNYQENRRIQYATPRFHYYIISQTDRPALISAKGVFGGQFFRSIVVFYPDSGKKTIAFCPLLTL